MDRHELREEIEVINLRFMIKDIKTMRYFIDISYVSGLHSF